MESSLKSAHQLVTRQILFQIITSYRTNRVTVNDVDKWGFHPAKTEHLTYFSNIKAATIIITNWLHLEISLQRFGEKRFFTEI